MMLFDSVVMARLKRVDCGLDCDLLIKFEFEAENT